MQWSTPYETNWVRFKARIRADKRPLNGDCVTAEGTSYRAPSPCWAIPCSMALKRLMICSEETALLSTHSRSDSQTLLSHLSRPALSRRTPSHPLAHRADRTLRFLVCAVKKQGFPEKSLPLSRLAKQCLMSNRACCRQRRRKRGLD